MELLVTIFLLICAELYMKYVQWKIRRKEEAYQRILNACTADFLKNINLRPQPVKKEYCNEQDSWPQIKGVEQQYCNEQDSRSCTKVLRSNTAMNKTHGLTHRSEYEELILRFLKLNGGQATISEVMKYISEQMEGKFTAADLASKNDRKNMLNWEYAVHWSRTKLANEGKIITGAPRGVWKLKT